MRIIEPETSREKLPALLNNLGFSEGTGGRIPADDPRLEALLAGASTAIRNHCGWHISPMIEETLTLDYDGSGVLILPTLKLESVADLRVRGIETEPVEWSASGEVKIPKRFGEGWRTVEITIVHGYFPDDVLDLVQVVQQVVANAVASPMGATAERAGQVSANWAQTAPGVSGGMSLLGRDLEILDAYRIGSGA